MKIVNIHFFIHQDKRTIIIYFSFFILHINAYYIWFNYALLFVRGHLKPSVRLYYNSDPCLKQCSSHVIFYRKKIRQALECTPRSPVLPI